MLLLLALAFTSCRKDEKPIRPFDRGDVITNAVEMGNNYKTHFFFSLSENRIVSAHLKADWDLAFESSSPGTRIRLNTGKMMTVYETQETAFANVTDTNGYMAHVHYDTPTGNLDSTAIGNWTSHQHVYIVDRGFDNNNNPLGFVKLKLLAADANGYTIRYANLDGLNEHTVTVPRNTANNFSFFSMTTNAVATIEPGKDNYDLWFTQFMHLYHAPFMPYNVTGILTNPDKVQAAQVYDKPFDQIVISDTLTHPFQSGKINVVGFEWKAYNLQTSMYTVDVNKCYLVRDRKGFIYKLHFIGFYDQSGVKGAPKFEFRKL